jgi:hypothetical protein
LKFDGVENLLELLAQYEVYEIVKLGLSKRIFSRNKRIDYQ